MKNSAGEFNKILVTDSLFIFPEHEEKMRAAGFEVLRLDKPRATDDEIVSHLQQAVGYILGGIEIVTTEIVTAAPHLRAISFTGSGFHEFIPGLASATQKGIAVSAAIGANAAAVAEYALTLTLALVRRLPELTTPGGKSFLTVRGFRDTTIGIIGFGHIGKEYARLVSALGFQVRVAQGSKADPDTMQYPVDEVLRTSDVISLHVSKPRGTGVLSSARLKLLRPGTAIVNTAFGEAIDMAALEPYLADGSLYLAADFGATLHTGAALGHYLSSNSQTAFNTTEANKSVSDRATNSILNLLLRGEDEDLVNPEFRKFVVK